MSTEQSVAKSCLIHMRLVFNLFLLPIFLLNLCAFHAPLGARTWFVAILLHVFLYSGTNAFNSYYDRDEGPIGALEKPPPVQPALLPFSLALKAIALVGGFALDRWIGFFFCGFAVLSVAYSHPAIRWKAQPFGSLSVVFVGQGLLVAAIASRLAGLGLGDWQLLQWCFALGISVTVVGFYLFSHMYQGDEDARRGDRTFTVRFGAEASLAWGLRLQAAGFALIFAGFTGNLFLAMGLPLAASLGAERVVPAVRERLMAGDRIAVFRRLMRLNWIASSVLNAAALLFLLIR